jgi:hypothetical protein
VWAVLSGALAGIDRILEGAPRERFQAFRAGAGPAGPRPLGWEPASGEDDLTRQARGTVLTTLA